MYLIAGLGNPTSRYEGTRHNVGFETIDRIASENHIDLRTRKHKAIYGMGMIAAEKVILAKPQTYMNLSGESIREISSFYKIPAENIIIIHDDTDLPVGQLRIREKGSAGGHNGLKSIISCIGSQDFKRIRIGIGSKPGGWDLADYVLSRYDKEDRKAMDEGQKDAADAVRLMVGGDTAKAMTRYNKKNKKAEKKVKYKDADKEKNIPEDAEIKEGEQE